MNRFRSLIGAAALTAAVLFTASPVFAQTALSATTFAAAVDNVQQTVVVASATGITAAGSGAGFVYLLADHEILTVRTLPGASTTVTVMRGQNGTRATSHINGAAVTVVPPLALINYLPTGQCTRTNLLYVPMVVGGSIDQAFNGTTLDCLGVTTAGQWVQTNLNGFPVFGSTVASASTIAATGTYFKVSGTTAVVTITLPAGAAAGFYITIEATGVLTWTAAGNILTAGTYTAAGHTVTFYWNGSKWVPDKVA